MSLTMVDEDDLVDGLFSAVLERKIRKVGKVDHANGSSSRGRSTSLVIGFIRDCRSLDDR